MFLPKMFRFLLIVFLCCWVNCEEESSGLKLDEPTRKLVVKLFHEFSNKTRLAELITNGINNGQAVNTLERFPVKPVAEIYRNYTLNQIAALETELDQHDHFIYKPIEDKAKEVKNEFRSACESYEQEGDLNQFENKFLETGKELVSLQKLVIRIINSKLEDKLKTDRKTNFRSGRNWIYNMFDRLNSLFLGKCQSIQIQIQCFNFICF